MSEGEGDAPLDVLETVVGDEVTIQLKSGDVYHGTLAGCDQYLNVALSDVVDTQSSSLPDHAHEAVEGPLVIRGDTVVAIATGKLTTGTSTETGNVVSTDELSTRDDDVAPASETEAGGQTALSVSSSPSSPSLSQLKTHLEEKGLTVVRDEETLLVTKLGQEYRIYPDQEVEGDGPFRSRLESVVATVEGGD